MLKCYMKVRKRELAVLEMFADSRLKVKPLRFQEYLTKQCFQYAASDPYKPLLKTVNN